MSTIIKVLKSSLATLITLVLKDMSQFIDPKTFGLHPSTRVTKTGANRFTIVMQRKSRIIMKDGRNILSKVEQIKSRIDSARVDVRTTAPVCSKTSAFLKEQGIDIKSDGE